jgi:tetratricopeptide (TPR) repeat protein
MSDEHKAVFLSYASQDAEAARRICEALRQAGVEVWFDRSELRGGDAWDTKIRKQIKECALFVPIISGNTQARTEGYFRLEWRLADHRTHLMGRSRAFVVPVCIDDTRDAQADVPDSFVAVQWVRLPGGEPNAQFCARVQTLLGGGGGGSGRSDQPAAREGIATSTTPHETLARPASARLQRRSIAAAGLLVAVLLATSLWRPWQDPAAPSQAAARAVPAFPRDPELKRAMELINGMEANSEDFALAEEIAKNALARNSVDPEAVIVMARVQVAHLFRGIDRADARYATARRYAERAFQLAPNDPEALGALGVYHLQLGGDFERARDLLNRAIALKPGDPFFHRHRNDALFRHPKVPASEALASAEKTAALFPADALAHYDLARHYRDLGRAADFERELDRAIAITPLANAIVWKARIALWMRGDVAEMKALLDRVPARVRSIERVVLSRWAYAMVSGDYEEGRVALTNLTSNWVEDFDYVGPKALLVAQLFELEGKRELARLQYEAALLEVRARQTRAAGAPNLRRLEAWILHGLGRDAEARGGHRAAIEAIARPYRFARMAQWWFTAIPAGLLIGERASALQLIREAVDPANTAQERPGIGDSEIRVAPEPAAEARAALRMHFQFDPRVARFRDDPEIVALLSK